MRHQIEHQENDTSGAFFIQTGGKRLAELTYVRTNASLITIDHTLVDPSLGGQGVGRSLLNALVQWARATGTKVVPICSYAKAQFDKDASIRDVLASPTWVARVHDVGRTVDALEVWRAYSA